jgi:hypothetical protein
MNPLRRRIETLEQHTEITGSTLIVVGELAPSQAEAIERGLIGTVIEIPENGRDLGEEGQAHQEAPSSEGIERGIGVEDVATTPTDGLAGSD